MLIRFFWASRMDAPRGAKRCHPPAARSRQSGSPRRQVPCVGRAYPEDDLDGRGRRPGNGMDEARFKRRGAEHCPVSGRNARPSAFVGVAPYYFVHLADQDGFRGSAHMRNQISGTKGNSLINMGFYPSNPCLKEASELCCGGLERGAGGSGELPCGRGRRPSRMGGSRRSSSKVRA